MECIGFPASALSEAERAKAEAIMASQPEGALLSLRLYPNRDLLSNEESIGSGMMAIFSPDARVDPTLLSEELFQRMAVVKIPACASVKHKLNAAYFGSCAEAIRGAVDQFPTQALDAEVRNPRSNKELKPWASELGGTRSFAGIFEGTDPENPRIKDYYVVARGTVPLIGAELKRHLAQAPCTWRELVGSEAWARELGYGTYASRRNIYRNIANVAEACAVEVGRVDDIGAKLLDGDHAPPEMAVPDWEQSTNSIREVVYKGKPAVAVCYGVVPAEECLASEGRRFFVASNPYDGIAVFELSHHEPVLDSMALPADTGRKPAAAAASSATQHHSTEGMVWDGPQKVNSDLNVDAWNPIGAPFKDAMKQQFGWNSERAIQRLVPIAVKLYNDALIRT